MMIQEIDNILANIKTSSNSSTNTFFDMQTRLYNQIQNIFKFLFFQSLKLLDQVVYVKCYLSRFIDVKGNNVWGFISKKDLSYLILSYLSIEND